MNIAVCLACGAILRAETIDFMCNCPNESRIHDDGRKPSREGKDLGLIRECLTFAEAKRVSHMVGERNCFCAKKRLDRGTTAV